MSAETDYKESIVNATPDEKLEAYRTYLSKTDYEELLYSLQYEVRERYAAALNEYTHREVKQEVYLKKRIEETVYWYMQQLVKHGLLKRALPLSWFDKFAQETLDYEKDVVVPGAISEDIRPLCVKGRDMVNALYRELHLLCEEPLKSNPDIYIYMNPPK